MAIGKSHLGIAEAAHVALPVDAARLDQHVLGLAAIGAAVHAQRAADGAGNAAQKRQPRDAGLLRRARHHDVEHGGAGDDAMAVFDCDVVEAAAEPDHHARHAAVAHDQIGAGADHGDGDFGRQVAQEISQIVFVLRHEERLRRTADAKPGEFAERLVGQQPPAQFRHAGFQVGHDVGEAHSAFNSPGSA